MGTDELIGTMNKEKSRVRQNIGVWDECKQVMKGLMEINFEEDYNKERVSLKGGWGEGLEGAENGE